MLMVGGYTSPLPLGSDVLMLMLMATLLLYLLGVMVLMLMVGGYTSPLPLGSDGVNVNGWWLHFSFTSWE